MEYDVVVVGGGAAGLTAAMVLARARRRLAVVDAGEPRNAPAAHAHGFLSRDGMSPAELLAAGRGEVVGNGGEVIKGRARGIEHGGEYGFVVHLAAGRELTTRGVLVTTGLIDELPEVPGLRERWGNDVLHCPYCHGYEVRDAPCAAAPATGSSWMRATVHDSGFASRRPARDPARTSRQPGRTPPSDDGRAHVRDWFSQPRLQSWC